MTLSERYAAFLPPTTTTTIQYRTAHPDPRPDAAAAIRHPVPVFVDQTKVSYTYNDYQATAAAAAKVAQTRRVHSFASVWVHAGCGCCR